MIYTFVVDAADTPTAGLDGLLRAFSLYGMVKEGKDELGNGRRAAAWCAVGSAYEWLTEELGRRRSLPLFHRDLLGKPIMEFSEGDLIKSVSISYSSGLVAIAFGDNPKGLGVDIEEERELKNPEKIENRITINVNDDLQFLQKNSVVYYYAKQEKDGRLSSFMRIPDCVFDRLGDKPHFNSQREKRLGAQPVSTLQKWTVTEALLKADGGGFCRLGELCEIKRVALCESGAFNHRGRTVYLSIALII